MGEQKEEVGGCKCGWEWGNREKREREVNVSRSAGTEGREGGL